MILSSFTTKKHKSTKNNTLYREKINLIFVLLFIFIGTEMPKFWQNSVILCQKKNIMKKSLFYLFFFRTVMYQTLKCMESHLYGEIKRFFQKHAFSVFFSLLGTKTINNIRIILYGNPKENY